MLPLIEIKLFSTFQILSQSNCQVAKSLLKIEIKTFKGLGCLINKWVLKVAFRHVLNYDVSHQPEICIFMAPFLLQFLLSGQRGPPTGQRWAPTGEIGSPKGPRGPTQRVRRGLAQGLEGRQLCLWGALLCPFGPLYARSEPLFAKVEPLFDQAGPFFAQMGPRFARLQFFKIKSKKCP